MNSAIYRGIPYRVSWVHPRELLNFYSFRNEADSLRTDVFVVLDFAQPSLQE
jgi:hypothetical protein